MTSRIVQLFSGGEDESNPWMLGALLGIIAAVALLVLVSAFQKGGSVSLPSAGLGLPTGIPIPTDPSIPTMR